MIRLTFTRFFLSEIKKQIKLASFRSKWAKRNKHNFTTPNTIFPIDLVKVGNGTYGRINVLFYGARQCSLEIGHYCSISSNVSFLLDGEHDMSAISTYPYRTKYHSNKNMNSRTKGPIIVGNDVWIGYGCTILSGVTIGQGAVIGACSIVTKDIPPYAIVAGAPAKIVRFRFPEEIIDQLLQIDFALFDRAFINNNLELIEKPIENVSDLSWLLSLSNDRTNNENN